MHQIALFLSSKVKKIVGEDAAPDQISALLQLQLQLPTNTCTYYTAKADQYTNMVKQINMNGIKL